MSLRRRKNEGAEENACWETGVLDKVAVVS
jgi:hypothetical protein